MHKLNPILLVDNGLWYSDVKDELTNLRLELLPKYRMLGSWESSKCFFRSILDKLNPDESTAVE